MKRHRLLVPLMLLTLALGGCFAHPFAGVGSIHVTSEPPQSKVYLNGEDTGKVTPVVLKAIPSGIHHIHVEFPGSGEGFRTVVVQKGKQATVHFTLGQASLTGFVGHSLGGSAVEGATIVAYEAGTNVEVASTTTDTYGSYQLNLPNGNYDILAFKSNHSQGRVQNVAVDSMEPATADIILRTIFDTTKASVAPTISVEGIEAGDIIDG